MRFRLLKTFKEGPPHKTKKELMETLESLIKADEKEGRARLYELEANNHSTGHQTEWQLFRCKLAAVSGSVDELRELAKKLGADDPLACRYRIKIVP